MKTWKVALQVCAGIGLLVAGGAAGVWFASNYDIVPKGVFPTTPPGPPPPFPESLTRAAAPAEGEANYVFTAGERLRYRLTAEVIGSGVEQANDPMDIDLDFGADMALDTMAVNTWGEGELELRFEQVQMNGRFMGGPVQLAKNAGGTQFNMPGFSAVDTRQGQSVQGIPQLAFFDTPIEMRVGRDGVVRDVRGVEGFEKILAQVPVLASSRMPDTGVPLGTRWESSFSLPVPGLAKPPKAHATNTFTGYQNVQDRRCAVVSQVLTAEQTEGLLDSPESILGGAMSFSMPKFLLSGNNTLYYDADTGRLVHSDIDLHFGLEIERELKGATQLLGMYGSLLDDIEGGTSNTRLEIDTSKNLMELGVDIKAVFALFR